MSCFPTRPLALMLVTALLCLNVSAPVGSAESGDGPTDEVTVSESNGAAAVGRPQWRVGDTWVVETRTQPIQGREPPRDDEPVRLRWQFRVNKIEKIAGEDCYRVDIECVTPGRTSPQTSLWCDTRTLFLRQFQTQLAFQGRYRTVQESYATAKGATAPVITLVNVLPLSMPAFAPPGTKGLESSGSAKFVCVSQPLPAGAKDPSVIRFRHSVQQSVRPAGPKAVEALPEGFSKELGEEPLTEVELRTPGEQVKQLWRAGSPWPVYVEQGRTKAYLVPNP